MLLPFIALAMVLAFEEDLQRVVPYSSDQQTIARIPVQRIDGAWHYSTVFTHQGT